MSFTAYSQRVYGPLLSVNEVEMSHCIRVYGPLLSMNEVETARCDKYITREWHNGIMALLEKLDKDSDDIHKGT